MTPWIKMRSNLPKDPHVLRLAARLKQPVATVLGALYMLWALADEQTTDGRLVGWDAAMLDAHVGVSGFAEALAAGLDAQATDPWLTLEGGVPAVPDFDRHMSKGAKTRAIDARRKDHVREAAASEPSRTRNGEPVRDVSGVDRTKLGPEKRREEKKEKTPPVSASALTSPSPKPASGSASHEGEPLLRLTGVDDDREQPGAVDACATPSASDGPRDGQGFGRATDDRGATGGATESPPTSAQRDTWAPFASEAEAFEAFYTAYGFASHRGEAVSRYAKHVRILTRSRGRAPPRFASLGAAGVFIRDRAAAFKASNLVASPEYRQPNPASWLGSGRYDDDDSVWAKPFGRGGDRADHDRGIGGDPLGGGAARATSPKPGPGDRVRSAGSRGVATLRRT